MSTFFSHKSDNNKHASSFVCRRLYTCFPLSLSLLDTTINKLSEKNMTSCIPSPSFLSFLHDDCVTTYASKCSMNSQPYIYRATFHTSHQPISFVSTRSIYLGSFIHSSRTLEQKERKENARRLVRSIFSN